MFQGVRLFLVALLLVGEVSAFHGLHIRLHAVGHALADIGEMAEELRLKALCHTQRVGVDEHLTVGIGTGANADRCRLDLASDLRGEFGRHLLECDGKDTSLVEGMRVGKQLTCLSLLLGTKAIAAKLMDALRAKGMAKVCPLGNSSSCSNNCLSNISLPSPSERGRGGRQLLFI